MEIFIAVQSGVYRHDIVAACRTLEEAKELGKAAIVAEPDHYHSIEIVSRQVGKPGAEKGLGTLVPKRGPTQYKAMNDASPGPRKWADLLDIEWSAAEAE